MELSNSADFPASTRRGGHRFFDLNLTYLCCRLHLTLLLVNDSDFGQHVEELVQLFTPYCRTMQCGGL